jgi:hypothetical protein
MARKSTDCVKQYNGTPHKQDRRLTPPGRKRALSGRETNDISHRRVYWEPISCRDFQRVMK